MTVLANETRFAEGWCEPTLTHEQASEAYGQEIPPEAWAAIVNAFRSYSSAMQDRTALRDVRGKSRPESWHRAQESTLRTLDRAIRETCKATDERKLWEGAGLEDEREKLDAAFRQLIDVRRAIADLPVPEGLAPSVAEPERRLARSIRDALQSAGLCVRLTHGTFREIRRNNLSADDLTPFETLCRAFGIHGGTQPRAFIEWLRAALA